jgi:serine phosphatase RsbU (regulator of sigma subunit)
MTADEIRAMFARREIDHARHDAAALAGDNSLDCVLESPIAGTVRGRAGIEHVYRDIFSAFPDIQFEAGELLISGDRVVQCGTQTGTDTGGFLGLPPSGKRFRAPAVLLYTLHGGEIVHERRIYDFSGFLLQLATDNGPAIESTRLYRETVERVRMEQELKIAAEIQRTLQPETRHARAGIEIASTSLPCRAIGGDFHDYFDLPDGRFAFVLGDVAGKGPPAALVAGVVQGAFAANAYRGARPAEAMCQVNSILARRGMHTRFASVIYAVLTPEGRLTYCNAGHNPPVLIGRRGVQRLERGGLIAGAFVQASFDEETIQLDPGDMVVAFSDGLTEAQNAEGEDFGDDRMVAVVQANRNREPAVLLEALLQEANGFRGAADQNDDLTVLVLRGA